MTVRALPTVAGEMLESLYQHRLLTSHQLHQIHTPDSSDRWTRDLLRRLRTVGLVDFARAAGGSGSVYFLTRAGALAVERLTTRPAVRRELIGAAAAAGPLRGHTLAVNEVGIAFMQAARERGDEFGALAWQHEVAHQLGPSRRELLVSDALLNYLQRLEDGELVFHYRLLELDRATEPVDTLAAKLGRYARLYRNRDGWRERYPVFPGVISVLTAKPRAALERRLDTVLALCSEDPQLTATPQVEIALCLLDDLTAQGAFAAIWQRPDRPDERLDWLGRAPSSGNSGDRGPAR